MRVATEQLAASERKLKNARQLRILIIGFGNFGQFISSEFVKQGHEVVGTSRGDYSKAAAEIGCVYTRDAAEALSHDPHVVVLCTSIMSTAAVLRDFPRERLTGRLVVDVLSVKEYPKHLLLAQLPPTADILCTHPMFGPESGAKGWHNLPFVFERVRVAAGRGAAICDEFVGIWSSAGCKMVEMSCEEHDSHGAASQFITHTTGRMLAELECASTPINTRGYESLLGVVNTTVGDSFDVRHPFDRAFLRAPLATCLLLFFLADVCLVLQLFCGLFYYNAFSKHQLEKMELGLKKVRESLEAFEKTQLAADGGAEMQWSRDKRHSELMASPAAGKSVSKSDV